MIRFYDLFLRSVFTICFYDPLHSFNKDESWGGGRVTIMVKIRSSSRTFLGPPFPPSPPRVTIVGGIALFSRLDPGFKSPGRSFPA